MAENKKSFLLYADYLHTFEELTDEEAGQLIKHLLAYVNDKSPETDNRIIKIAFEPIKQQLKRDLKHWDTIKQKRSNAGKASVEAKKQTSTDSTHVNTCQQEPTNSTVTVNDNVNVTVNEDLYKRGDQFPKADLSLKIPEADKSTMIKIYNTRKGISITNHQVDKMWEVFKLQKLDGKTFYETPAEIIKHFKNWLPLQKIEINQEPIKEQSRDELFKHAQNLANRYS